MKHIVVAGGIGKDAVIRQAGDKQVTGWSVAVPDGWGENKRTIWFDCSWWGQRGVKVADYIKKGGKITVSGELSTREHDGKTYITINVSDVTLQGGGQEGRTGNNNQGGGYDQSPQGGAYGGGASGGAGQASGGSAHAYEMDDEVPF